MYHVIQVYVNVPCFAICFCTAADLFFNTRFFVFISSKILWHIQHLLPAGNTPRIIWPNSPMSQPPTEIAKSYPVSTYTNYIFWSDVTRCYHDLPSKASESGLQAELTHKNPH